MKRKINLHCTKCSYKISYKISLKMDIFPEGKNLTCPYCKTALVRRVRLDCVIEGCRRWTIVEGDPYFSNHNFYSKKYKKSIDIRNTGFVCSDHEEEFEKKREEKNVTD